MTNLIELINAGIAPDHHDRQWLTVDKPLNISSHVEISLQLQPVWGEYVPVLMERNTLTKAAHFTPIQDGGWLNTLTRSGYLEVIPKAIRRDQNGSIDAVLFDFIETPASHIFAV